MADEDQGLKFEYLVRFTLPKAMNASPSKQVAAEETFYHFADFARAAAKKAPEEFKRFVDELETRFGCVQKWRAPRGTYVAVSTFKNKDDITTIDSWPDGKSRYRLYQKTKTSLRRRRAQICSKMLIVCENAFG